MSALDAARSAAEAVRALNHLTLDPAGYTWPADVDAVVGELLTLAQRLPQAFTQAERWLETTYVAGRVGHDQGGDVEATVFEVLGDLARAGREARELALTLEAVRANSSHLTGHAVTAGAR